MRRPIPFVQQSTSLDCGTAALAMVLRSHGRYTSLQAIRSHLPTNPGSGVSAQQLLQAGEVFGLRGRAVAVDLHELSLLPRGAILHWEFRHYVVLDGADERGVRLLDPAVGPRTTTWSDAAKAFTGVAVVLDPGTGFEHASAPRSPVKELLLTLLGEPAWRRAVWMALTLQVLLFALPALTGIVIDDVLPYRDDSLLLLVAGASVVIAALHLLTTVVRGRLVSLVVVHTGLKLRADFLERLLRAPMRFVTERETGSVGFLYGGIESVLQAITVGALSGSVDAAIGALLCLLILWLQPAIGTLVIVVFLATVATSLWMNRRLAPLAASELQAGQRLLTEATETIQGFETIKSLGLESRQISSSLNRLTEFASVQGALEGIRTTADALQATIRFVAPIALLLFGVVEVRAEHLSLGRMLALAALAASAFQSLTSAGALLAVLPRVNAYLELVEEVLRLQPEQNAEHRRPCPSISGAVSLTSASFRYGPSLPLVLRDITINVRAGEFVAIVGRSGSGKSTLASILLGLHHLEAGSVQYDGERVDRTELLGLRRQIGYVPQRPHIFSRSIRDNIALGDTDLSLEAIIEVTKRAQLHEEILALPLGYDTLLGGSAVLSGGQRQRLALARALASRPKVLLLDEATSAVDALTERRIDEVIRELGCTRIVIAHRLSTIERADRIIVLDSGTVVADGPLDHVLSVSPLFRDLYRPSAPALASMDVRPTC